MGTSKGYTMPSGGNWEPLKREATDFVKNGSTASSSPKPLLRDYLKVRPISGASGRGASSGGTGRSSGGSAAGGSGGGRSGRRSGNAGIATAQRIGGFFSLVGEVGLAAALRELGLEDLIGKSAAELSDALLEEMAGPASTLDQAAAREALMELQDELLKEAETFQDVEQVLTKTIDNAGVVTILLRFLGHYIYQRFCTDFYEKWVKQVGSFRASQSLKNIRDCIEAAIASKLAGIDLKKFMWCSPDGKRLSDQVLVEVRQIFEVPA